MEGSGFLTILNPDKDPGGPKTYGSPHGSGSGTLVSISIFLAP
jgi:hypothetical protein